MPIKQKRIAKALTIIVIVLLSLASADLGLGFPDRINGKIDIFTQKEPFNGKGPNLPSDAFAPGEMVVLYALVEYNGQQLQNYLVTFHVQSPDGSSLTFTSTTNATGIASASFRIPNKCPPYYNDTFGEWTATADVKVGDNAFQDTLTFKVDWIIKLLSVRTINNNLVTQNYFGKNGNVGLEITLKNIAMVEKNVTLAITAMDDLNVPIDYLEIDNFEVQPNGKTLFLYCKITIPTWAFVGIGKVLVSALTALPSQNGVAYCPAISTEFWITISDPVKVEFHDVAVFKINPSANSVKIGETVYINVKVRNEGTTFDSFNVSLYVNSQIIYTLNVLNLAPYSTTTLRFTINTSNIGIGKHLVSAFIPPISNEVDFTDNSLSYDSLEIRPAGEFLVTFQQTGLSADSYGVILTINGSTKTVYDLPYSIWVEKGSIITYAYEEIALSTVSGKRFKLNNIDGPYPSIIVTSNLTIVANYRTQYYLLVYSLYGSPSPLSGWFDAGTSITASVISPWLGPEKTRYVCLGWVGNGSAPSSGKDLTVTFTIYQPSSIIWHWKTQYFLTVLSPFGIASGVGWYDANETAYVSLDVGVINHGNGTRQIFVFWSGDASGTNHTKSGPILMDKPKTAIANWKTQHLLTVITDPTGLNPQPSRSPSGDADLIGSIWYDVFVNVSLSAPSVEGYDFIHWDVDGIAKDSGVHKIVICMDGPHAATAHYKVIYEAKWLYLLLIVILIMLIILLGIMAYRRVKRKRNEKEAFKKGWIAWYYGYNILGRYESNMHNVQLTR
ncbi:MAG: CARDB domain-containing protein [Candidatus Bathyarchaeia archaeon]